MAQGFEMITKLVPFTVCFGILSSCGQHVPPLVAVMRDLTTEAQKEDTYGQLLASVSASDLAQVDFPVLYVDMESIRDETFMRPHEVNGRVETWIGTQGSSLAMVDGIIISTRGYGHDLAVSSRPDLKALLKHSETGQSYATSYRYWDYEERLVTKNGNCSAERREQTILERCLVEGVEFQNHYDLRDGTIQASRQWVSAERGYVSTKRLK